MANQFSQTHLLKFPSFLIRTLSTPISLVRILRLREIEKLTQFYTAKYKESELTLSEEVTKTSNVGGLQLCEYLRKEQPKQG